MKKSPAPVARIRLGQRPDARQPADHSFFAGLFASITAWSTPDQAAVFALGIFTGSLPWWLVLTGSVAGTAKRFSPNVLAWINRLSGLVLAGFALYALSALL